MLIRLFIYAAVVVLTAAALIKIKGVLEARLFWENDQPCLSIELGNPRFKNYRLARYESPLSSLQVDSLLILCRSKTGRIQNTMANFNKASLLLGWLVIQRLEWKSVLGMGDAMVTALANGTLWAFKGWVISMISRKSRLQKLELRVSPDFSEKYFESRVYCIFKIRIVHIIFMTVYLLALKAGKRQKRLYTT